MDLDGKSNCVLVCSQTCSNLLEGFCLFSVLGVSIDYAGLRAGAPPTPLTSPSDISPLWRKLPWKVVVVYRLRFRYGGL